MRRSSRSRSTERECDRALKCHMAAIQYFHHFSPLRSCDLPVINPRAFAQLSEPGLLLDCHLRIDVAHLCVALVYTAAAVLASHTPQSTRIRVALVSRSFTHLCCVCLSDSTSTLPPYCCPALASSCLLRVCIGMAGRFKETKKGQQHRQLQQWPHLSSAAAVRAHVLSLLCCVPAFLSSRRAELWLPRWRWARSQSECDYAGSHVALSRAAGEGEQTNAEAGARRGTRRQDDTRARTRQ